MLQNGSIVIIKIQYIMVTVIIAVVAIDIIIRGRIFSGCLHDLRRRCGIISW